MGSTYGFDVDDMLIERSGFTGPLTASSGIAGGLVGQATYGYSIKDSYVNANVVGNTAGGILGLSTDACGYRYITNVAAYGTVNGGDVAGGLVGQMQNHSCHVTQVTNSIANVVMPGSGIKGGLFGVLNGVSMTTGGLFFSQASAATADCFGQTNSASPLCSDLGSNLPPSSSPFDAWDFENIWTNNGGLAVVSWPIDTSIYHGPATPTDLAAVEGDTKDQVHISWAHSTSHSDVDFDQYNIEIKESGYSWDNILYSNNTGDNQINFDPLELGKTFDIRVQAKNSYGAGDWVETSYTTPVAEEVNISSCQELQDFDVNYSWLDNINLTSDIDCSNIESFRPIGWSDEWDGSSYRGRFEGNNHKITNLNINEPSSCGVGLIAYLDHATVKDLSLESGTITSQCYTGSLAAEAYNTKLQNIHSGLNIDTNGYEVGGIIGYVEYYGGFNNYNISGLSYNGDINSSGSNIGGIFGELQALDTHGILSLTRSYTSGNIYGSGEVGGLIGYAYVENDEDDGEPLTSLLIQDVYSKSNVYNNQYNSGGVIGYAETYNDGYNSEASLTINNAYNAGEVIADQDYAGGLIGHMDTLSDDFLTLIVNNSFSVGQVSASSGAFALIGGSDWLNDGTYNYNNNYFDIYNTGQDQSDYLAGIENGHGVNETGEQSTLFMGNNQTAPLSSWNFNDIWQIEADDFPSLRAINFDDLNGDNILDQEQPRLSGYTSPITGKKVLIDTGVNCQITTDDINAESDLSAQDTGYDYANGLFDFAGECGEPGFSTTIKLYYYGVQKEGLVVRKYNPNTNTYSNIEDAQIDSQTINGQQVTVVTYALEDGGVLDMDGG